MSDTHTHHQQIGYFRYAVIAPLLTDEPGSTLKERIQKQAERIWMQPDGKVKRIGFGTIEHWLYDYKRGGIKALQSQCRNDAGTFRGIDDKLAETLDKIIGDHPKLRPHAIIEHLRRKELLGDSPPGQSTLYRYIKSQRPAEPPRRDKKERRCFEAPYAGYLWQADIMYGVHLLMELVNGRKRKQQTYLIAIIDDHSRLLCHGEFFFRQDLATWICCLETAIQKRGIPKKLYCDNGQVFVSCQIKEIAARLGMEILHTPVRDGAAKGKIEKYFQKVRRSFLEPIMELDPPDTIDKLNKAFFEWAETEYNHGIHSAFNDTPIRRFMESSSHMRTLTDNSKTLFHVRCSRRVKKDGTFSLNGTRFETVPALAGCKITLSYDLRETQIIFVYWQDKYYGKANLLDPKANCTRLYRRNSKQNGDQDNA